jgi:MinD-like ATPase involved in chromosome partitioning or flagellar assembly
MGTRAGHKARVGGLSPVGEGGGTVVTVFSAKGGCGKTTLAINLAAALSDGGRREVCLVDLDLAFGDVGVALHLFPRQTILDAVPLAEVLDPTVIEALLTPYSAGFSTLLAPIQPEAAESIGAALVSELIDLLRAQFEYVLIDTPPAFTDHVLAAIDQSNVVILVTTPDKRGLQSLRLTLDTLDLLNQPRERQRVVLNRAPPAADFRIVEVETMLHMSISAHVPSSRDVPASINRGHPIVLEDPQHPVSQAIKGLAEQSDRWPGQHPAQRKPRLSLPSLGERLAEYLRHATDAQSVTAHVTVHGPPGDMSPTAEAGLLRLGFDAIALTCKHTGAHHVWVSVHLAAPVTIRIEDDGTGPVSKHEVSRRLRALAGLAVDVGAYLAVGPREPQGTVIEITAA